MGDCMNVVFNGLTFFADVFFYLKWANGTLSYSQKKKWGGGGFQKRQ